MFAGESAVRRVRGNNVHQSASGEQVVDDDDGWLGETALFVCQQRADEDNELGKAAKETPDHRHLTLEYVKQLVAALQETRRHLDSIAKFVSNEHLKTSRSGIGVDDAHTAEGTDRIPWEIMYREWELPDLRAPYRSISTQTENSNDQEITIRPGNSRESERTSAARRTPFDFKETVDSYQVNRRSTRHRLKDNRRGESPYKGEAIAQAMLNEISVAFQKRTRNRMSIVGHHYRKLYRRHLKLRRQFRNQKRLFRHLERQHEILLESIGDQVDELALDWAQRVRHLLKATAPNADHLNDDEREFGRSRLNKGVVKRSKSVAWQQWHAVLSLKLDWVRSSHGTVVDHLILRLAKQL